MTTSSSTSTVSGAGTITAYTPGSDYISFRTETSTEPVKYYYTKKTVLVDADGRTVDWSLLRPDLPVRYEYVKDGDRMVVSKVTVTKPLATFEKKKPRRLRRLHPNESCEKSSLIKLKSACGPCVHRRFFLRSVRLLDDNQRPAGKESAAPSIAVAVGKFLMPFPRASDDGVEILELWSPAKLAFYFI